jgi:hypothetical protein
MIGKWEIFTWNALTTQGVIATVSTQGAIHGRITSIPGHGGQRSAPPSVDSLHAVFSRHLLHFHMLSSVGKHPYPPPIANLIDTFSKANRRLKIVIVVAGG